MNAVPESTYGRPETGAHSSSPRTVLVVVLVVAALAAVGTTIIGFVLAGSYYPDAFLDGGVAGQGGRSASRSSAYTGTATVGLLGSLFGGVAVAWARQRRQLTGQRLWLAAGCGASAAWFLAALATKGSVEWVNLGLQSVAAGTDISGYWAAAFDDEVQFVVVDGAVVEVGAYRMALLVHLSAPLLAALALGACLWAVRPGRPTPSPRDPEAQ